MPVPADKTPAIPTASARCPVDGPERSAWYMKPRFPKRDHSSRWSSCAAMKNALAATTVPIPMSAYAPLCLRRADVSATAVGGAAGAFGADSAVDAVEAPCAAVVAGFASRLLSCAMVHESASPPEQPFCQSAAAAASSAAQASLRRRRGRRRRALAEGLLGRRCALVHHRATEQARREARYDGRAGCLDCIYR